MQSHYNINIAKQWAEDEFGKRFRHFAEVTLDCAKVTAYERWYEFQRRFPESEGWRVEMTYWSFEGTEC